MNSEHVAALGRGHLIRFEEDTLRQRPLWVWLITGGPRKPDEAVLAVTESLGGHMITLASCAEGEPGGDQLCLAGLDGPDLLRWSPAHAHALTLHLLRGLADRAMHSRLAGLQAWRVRTTVPAADADLLVSAALLHDIGYAPALRQTGFHPIDGANFLLRLGAPTRLAALVAHHSEAHLLAAAHGLRPQLSRFHREEGPITDALTYADMTAGPRGVPMSVPDRLADIAARHAHEDPQLVAARQARVPLLLAATERVRLRAVGTADGRYGWQNSHPCASLHPSSGDVG
jgi:hypothetical protein